MLKICLRRDNEEWTWLNHVGSYGWDEEDYIVLEVPDTCGVNDVDNYIKDLKGIAK